MRKKFHAGQYKRNLGGGVRDAGAVGGIIQRGSKMDNKMNTFKKIDFLSSIIF
jgi:hypothetical protein